MVRLIIVFLSSIFTFSPFSDGFGPDAIGRKATSELFIIPIATSYDIITKTECSLQTTLTCLLNSYSFPACFSNIFNERVTFDSATKNSDKDFLKYLKTCSLKKVKNLPLKNTAISLPTNQNGGITENFIQHSIFQQCAINITECLKARKCAVQFEYNIFDKIIKECSEEGFKKLNMNFTPSKPVITTYIDDLQELGIKKIGNVKDVYVSKLSQQNIDIFGSLTYNDLDSIKIIASNVPYLKQFLCDSQEDSRISKSFESVEPYLLMMNMADSPKIPDTVKKAAQTFTAETYVTVKEMLKVHPHFRWLICSSIFAISEKKDLTNIFDPSNFLYFG